MQRTPLKNGARYLLNGSTFVIHASQKNDGFLVEYQSFGGQQLVTRQELLTAWERGEVVFEVDNPHTKCEEDP